MTYQAETRVLPIDPDHPDPAAIAEAAAVLRRGGLVAFPTETVYGLGANALDAAAVGRIYAAKGRPASDPLIVHIASPAQLAQVADEVPPLARTLSERFWPGPLTLVMARNAAIPPIVSAGTPTVAVRIPSHPVAHALLRESGLPVAAPSANRFARPSPTTAEHVLADLSGRVDLVLDGGPTPVGIESTVLDLTQTPPVVLRPGGVPLETLREIIPHIQHAARYLDVGDAAAAPGMLLKHYSPRAQVLLFDGPREATLVAMSDRARAYTRAGTKVGVMAVDDDLPAFADLPVERRSLGPAADLALVARRLFSAMRDLDARGVDVILVRAPARSGLGLAVYDRLLRAAEGQVIQVDG